MKTSVLHVNPSRRRESGALARTKDTARVGRSIKTFLLLSAMLGSFGNSFTDTLRMLGSSNDVKGRERFNFDMHKAHLRSLRNIRRGGRG